jgi:hypothetical protein
MVHTFSHGAGNGTLDTAIAILPGDRSTNERARVLCHIAGLSGSGCTSDGTNTRSR